MYPLYLKIQGRGQIKTTKLKRIQGDIWVCLRITDNLSGAWKFHTKKYLPDNCELSYLCTFPTIIFPGIT